MIKTDRYGTVYSYSFYPEISLEQLNKSAKQNYRNHNTPVDTVDTLVTKAGAFQPVWHATPRPAVSWLLLESRTELWSKERQINKTTANIPHIWSHADSKVMTGCCCSCWWWWWWLQSDKHKIISFIHVFMYVGIYSHPFALGLIFGAEIGQSIHGQEHKLDHTGFHYYSQPAPYSRHTWDTTTRRWTWPTKSIYCQG